MRVTEIGCGFCKVLASRAQRSESNPQNPHISAGHGGKETGEPLGFTVTSIPA